MGQITTAQRTQHNQYTLLIETGFYCIYLPLSQQLRAVKASAFSPQQGVSIGLNNCSWVPDSLNVIRVSLVNRVSHNIDEIGPGSCLKSKLGRSRYLPPSALMLDGAKTRPFIPFMIGI